MVHVKGHSGDIGNDYAWVASIPSVASNKLAG